MVAAVFSCPPCLSCGFFFWSEHQEMQSHLPLVSTLPTALYWLLSLPKTWPCLGSSYLPTRGSLVAQLERNLPVMQETPVRFLGWEDTLEKGVGYPLQYSWASLVAQLVKNPPAMQETWV